MQRAKVRMTTVHWPTQRDKRTGKVIRDCTHSKPECNETHFYQVPAIETRGSFPLSHMLSNSSAKALLTVYVALGGRN